MGWGGREQVGTQVVNVSKNKHPWGESGEICRESIAAGLPVSFFSGKSCWVWAEKVTGSCDCTCFWWALLYFLVLSHVYLSFASHCVV